MLNEILTSELTAINQYFIHYKMCETGATSGFPKGSAKSRSRDEARRSRDRAHLVLGRRANMQRLSPVRVGEERSKCTLDLTLELEAVARLNAPSACLPRDGGTRELVEHILTDEEDSIDWLEAQLHQLTDMGRENYLAQQLDD